MYILIEAERMKHLASERSVHLVEFFPFISKFQITLSLLCLKVTEAELSIPSFFSNDFTANGNVVQSTRKQNIWVSIRGKISTTKSGILQKKTTYVNLCDQALPFSACFYEIWSQFLEHWQSISLCIQTVNLTSTYESISQSISWVPQLLSWKTCKKVFLFI